MIQTNTGTTTSNLGDTITDTTFLMSSPDPVFTVSAIVSSDDSVDAKSMEPIG